MEHRYYYLTDEDRAIAEANGIKRTTLLERIYSLGWSIEKAITTPPKNRPFVIDEETAKLLKKNGIKEITFKNRVKRYGWSIEKARTTPTLEISEICTMKKPPLVSREQYIIAESNGISRSTVYHRVSIRGWNIEKAITTPPLSKNQIKYGKKLRERG